MVLETSIPSIVKRMETEQRPQAFYIASPLRVYTLEANPDGTTHRQWHRLEPHQMILFDKLVNTEYTPTEADDLTDDDYTYAWWLCFAKELMNRHEYAMKCILLQHQACYLPCSSTDEVNLIPVGQRGSSNANKLQVIQNLIEQFPLPVNVKLAQLPGSYAYKDFPGHIQLLGSRAEEMAICASLSSTHLAAIPVSTPLKFVVASLPPSSSSPQIQQILSGCGIFRKSFDMQIRRILTLTDQNTTSQRRSRSRYPKIQEAIDQQLRSFKRSNSVDQNTTNPKHSPSAATTDEGYRSGSAAAKRRNYHRQSRAASEVKDPLSRSIDQFSPCFCLTRTVKELPTHRHVKAHLRPMKIGHTIPLLIRRQQRKNRRHHRHRRHQRCRRSLRISPIRIDHLPTIATVISLMPSNMPGQTVRFWWMQATNYFLPYHPIADLRDRFLFDK